jgi:parallel beta-helix repeat protein
MQIEPISNDELQIHEPIIIESDEDFENQEWPGNGTQENPYLIENLRIESSVPCIAINNTRNHFIIQNCHIWSRANYYPTTSPMNEPTIQFSNVTNGNIIKCVIESRVDAIEIYNTSFCSISENVITSYPLHRGSGEGIITDQIMNCTLSHNLIFNLSSGILVHQAYFSLIENNTIVENGIGLGLGDNYQTLVINNTVVFNSEGISVGGNNNIIFGNRIGSNGYMTVRDHGDFNQWDDNISIGNGWYDYNGTGVYVIPGLANSIDRYPWLCTNFNYTINDYFGPLIRFNPWALVTMTQAGPHETHSFMARVNDPASVDSVFVFYRFSEADPFTCLELNSTPSEEHPDSYSHTIRMNDPYDITLYYYYWANDSLGNSRQAPMDRFFWHTHPDVIPDSLDEFAIIVVLTMGIIAILIIIYKKRR